MPSWELFERQDEAYRAGVLGTAPRVAVEAASTFGWTRYVASEADVVGMTGFGTSGPGDQVYRYFEITVDAVVDRARRHLAAGGEVPARAA
jgi:transketolase